MFPLCFRSSSFEDVISFKSFDSTGAFSFSSNLFNGVSFEWALTHRSFPRILPDSSYSPGVILKSSKVWRKNELSSVKCLSPRSSRFFSSLAQPLYFDSSGVSKQFMVVFPIVILCVWRPNKNFTSISYPFSQRFVVLVRGHPLLIVLIV